MRVSFAYTVQDWAHFSGVSGRSAVRGTEMADQAGSPRVRRSTEEWRLLLTRFSDSGLSVAGFCV